MRNFHRLTIALSAAALVGLLGATSSTARAENNFKPRTAASTPHRSGKPSTLHRLQEQVRRVNEDWDGCR